MSPTYVVFDGRTGSILGVSAWHDAESGSHTTQSTEAVLEQFSIPGVAAMTDELGVLETDLTLEELSGDWRVDVDQRELRPMARVRMESERTELEGDGHDSTEIQLIAEDAAGETLGKLNLDLQATTSRGRLSPKGGRVTLKKGRAQITVTAAPETVATVLVALHDPSGQCRPATLELAFL